ncbi:MAG: discoidin domain-containing protein [Clostridia bacterium]|nr:discoidin domain-containing protein [Clostridia bacterium]
MIKKSVSFALLLAMIISLVPAYATEGDTTIESNSKNVLYFCEDFDSARGSLVKSLEFGPKNNTIGIVDVGNGNKASLTTVNATESQKDDATFVKRFDVYPSGKVIIEVDLMVEDVAGCSKMVAMRSPNGGGSELYPIQITSSGQVIGTDGSQILPKMQEGKFYKFDLAMDFENGIYSVWVNGIRRAKNIDFQSSLGYKFKSLSLLLFSTRYAAPGCRSKYYVDNIKVYDGSRPLSDEEFSNTSWELLLGYDTPVSTDMVKRGMQNNVVLYIDAPNALIKGDSEPIDENNKKVVPYVKAGTTLVPSRFIIEALGGKVDYDDKSRTAHISLNGKTIDITAENEQMIVDGEKVPLSHPAQISHDRLFIPVRAMGELADKEVFWDKTGLIVLSDEKIDLNWRDNLSYLSAVCGEMVYERPVGEEILANVRKLHPEKSHPRIFMDNNGFETVKKEIETDPTKAKWFEEIKKDAEFYYKKRVSTYGKTDGSRMSDQANQLIYIVKSCGFVYNVTGETKYADRVVEELEAILSFPDWNPHHFLDVGRYMQAVALCYDWMYDYLSEDLRIECRKSLREKAYSELMKDYLFLPRDRGFHWSEAATGDNWNTVINSGAMMSALAIGDEEDSREICEDVLTEAMLSIEAAFNMLAPDGSWYEGVGYWTGTASTMIYAMAALNSASGSDYGLFNVPGLKYAGHYLYEMSGSTGIFNFNYAPQRGYASPFMVYFAERLGNDSLKKIIINHMEQYSEPGDADSILFCGDVPGDDVDITLPLDSYYRGTESVSMRSTWDTDSMFYAGIHSGHNAALNGQLDAGTFVIDAYGNRFVYDLGTENYNLKGNFEKYRNRAEGNNCYIINPSTDFYDQLKAAYCYMEKYESNECSAYAITDLTAAYEGKVSSAVRGMKMTNNRTSVVLQDEIKCIEPSWIHWGFHTQANVTLFEDGKSAMLEIAGNRMEVRILSEDGRFETMKAEPLPESYQLEGQTPNTGVTKIVCNFKDATDVNLTVCFTPMGFAYDVDVKYPRVEKLAEWKLDEPGEALTTIVPNFKEYVFKDLRIDGKQIENFDPSASVYTVRLANRFVPKPKVEIESDYELEIIEPETWPGNISVILTKDGSSVEKVIKFTMPPETALDMTHNEVVPIRADVESLTEEDNPPENVLDHNFETRSAGATPNWISFDFGETKKIDTVVLAFYNGNARATIFDVEISDDGENWTQVFSGQSSGTTNKYEYFPIGDRTARYLRIVGKGTSTNEQWLSILEFRAFGRK